MKKLIVIASVLVTALVSCARINNEKPASEIMFQVARHSVATKADPADYKDAYQGVPFGAYAWYKAIDAQDNAPYITNKKVAYTESSNTWMTVGTTYYWPYTGALDFISYSPYSEDGVAAPAPVITENSISWSTPWNVDVHQDVDVMYADKVVGINGNVNTFNHGYEGVPTLFRHALARLAFQIRTGFTSRTVGGETTRWEIDINSITLDNIFTTGTMALSLAEDGSWAKPESNAWTPTTEATGRAIDVTGVNTLTQEIQIAGGSFFVLPQTLDAQRLTLNATIRTYRDMGEGEQLVITESDVVCHAPLKTDKIDTWGINQFITYILTVNPISDDESEYILFDPATVGWDEKVVETMILI